MNQTQTSFHNTKMKNTIKEKLEPIMKINEEKKYTPLNRQDFDKNVQKKWSEIHFNNLPPRRTNHISFIYKDYFYVFGGRDINESKMNDMYRINLDISQESQDNWEKIEFSGDIPKPVAGHKALVYGDRLFVFGGVNLVEESNNNLYILELEYNNWIKKEFSETEVISLTEHSMSLGNENQLVIFGGYSKGYYSNNTYIYDINEEKWDKYPRQMSKGLFSTTGEKEDYFEENEYQNDENTLKDKIIKNANNLKNDAENKIKDMMGIKDKNNDKKSRKQSEAKKNPFPENIANIDPTEDDLPPPRIFHSQTTTDNNLIFVYGGIDNEGKYLNDLWKFNPTNYLWEKIPFSDEEDIPKPRSGHSATFYNGEILFFGGKIGNIFEVNEFWKFDVASNKFSLIHDTLLEKGNFPERFERKKVKETVKYHDPYQTFYKLKKVEIPHREKKNEIKDPALTQTGFHQVGNKNKYEDVINGDNKSKIIKKSLIYRIDVEEQNFVKKLAQANRSVKFEKIKDGVVPLPRDGHSSFVYKDKFYVFGGDRNKYPFNDFFIFDFNKKIEQNNDEMKTQSNLNYTKSNKDMMTNNDEINVDKKSQVSQISKKSKRSSKSKTKKIKK